MKVCYTYMYYDVDPGSVKNLGHSTLFRYFQFNIVQLQSPYFFSF